MFFTYLRTIGGKYLKNINGSDTFSQTNSHKKAENYTKGNRCPMYQGFAKIVVGSNRSRRIY